MIPDIGVHHGRHGLAVVAGVPTYVITELVRRALSAPPLSSR
jgi:hypothetical protein